MRKLTTPTNAANPAWITVDQARSRYNLSRGSVMKIAEEAGAIIRIGRAIRINVSKLEAAYSR